MTAQVNINLTDEYFKFFIKTDQINDEYLTPEFKLSGIPWKIKVIKNAANGEDMINVFLQCSVSNAPESDRSPTIFDRIRRLSEWIGIGRDREHCSPVFEPNTSDWFCEAQATIKLQSNEPDLHTYKKTIPKTKFKKDRLSAGLTPFIKCSDLIKFGQNGKVILDIHVSANPVKFFTPSKIEQTRKQFRFIVENISKLSFVKSSEVVVRDNVWYVQVQKIDNHLEIFLSKKRNAQVKDWTYKTKCSFKLLSFDEDIEPKVLSMEKRFHHSGESWGFRKLVPWDELMNESNKYVLQDKAVFEIDLEVEPAKPSWNFDCGNPETGILECSICLQSVIGRNPTATKCGHLFCGACIKRTIEERKKCPLCNVDGSPTDLRPLYLSK